MKNPLHIAIRLVYHLLVLFVLFISANSVFVLSSGSRDSLVMILCIALSFFFWIWPAACSKDIIEGRVKQLWFGNVQLRIFLEATILTVAFSVYKLFINVPEYVTWKIIVSHIIISVVFLSITFWVGIIRLYLTSIQLGIKMRIVGIIFGLIFPLNLIVLIMMLRVTMEEVRFENEKTILDLNRKDEQICKTKYPILMLHGIFFRDFKYFDYWGRVPKELIINGARVFYGEQQSSASVYSCGDEVARKIREIVKTTGAEKVNIIAHSKGGLDARAAMTDPEIAGMVASLTTINTPHRGCEFADYLLHKTSEKQQKIVAGAYNAALKKAGDYAPDFIGGCSNLTREFCADFNSKVKDPEGVYIQSYGSALKNHRGGKFPLNLTYNFVGMFDGKNDGLVGEASFPWGSDFHMLTPSGNRGISHGDMIDLNRENIPGFDVREFYVQLVADLKKKGF